MNQCFDWLYGKVKKLKSKTGKIFAAIAIILFISSIATSVGNIGTPIIGAAVDIIFWGLSSLLSWLFGKGIELLLKLVPALMLLGFLIGEVVSALIDAFLDKHSQSVKNRFISKVNIYKFDAGDYFMTFLSCIF